MRHVIHLRVPGTLRYRDLAVRVVGAACKLVGAGEQDTGPSVSTAIGTTRSSRPLARRSTTPPSTAIAGAKPGDVDIEVDVGPTITSPSACIDYGTSFSLDDLCPQPDLDALPESGLGLFIIRSFMDEVTVPGRFAERAFHDQTSRLLIAGQCYTPSDEYDSGGGNSRQ